MTTPPPRRQALHAGPRAHRHPRRTAVVDAHGRRSYVTSAGSGPSVGKYILMTLPAAGVRRQRHPARCRILRRALPRHRRRRRQRRRVRSGECAGHAAKHEHPHLHQTRPRHQQAASRSPPTPRPSTPSTWASPSARTKSAPSKKPCASSKPTAARAPCPHPRPRGRRAAARCHVHRHRQRRPARDRRPRVRPGRHSRRHRRARIRARDRRHALRPDPAWQRSRRQRRLPGWRARGGRPRWPCITGLKDIKVAGTPVQAPREASGGRETFSLSLPAVLTVKEGLNLPRYPSLPGRLKAKKKPLEKIGPAGRRPAWPRCGSSCPAKKSTRWKSLAVAPTPRPRPWSCCRNWGYFRDDPHPHRT